MKALLSILLASLFVGCSISPEVVQVGVNRYLSSVTSPAGAAASASGMKVKAIRKASEFAKQHGGIAVETESKFNRPAVGFPTFDYYFTVVAP
jgi:hypothetical protein